MNGNGGIILRLNKCPISFILSVHVRRMYDHSRTQSPSYARSTERDEGLWPNPYQTGF